MNKIDEQAERHQATMDFYKSADDLAKQIAKEIRRLDAEERRELEESYQARMMKPEVKDDE